MSTKLQTALASLAVAFSFGAARLEDSRRCEFRALRVGLSWRG